MKIKRLRRKSNPLLWRVRRAIENKTVHIALHLQVFVQNEEEKKNTQGVQNRFVLICVSWSEPFCVHMPLDRLVEDTSVLLQLIYRCFSKMFPSI